MIQGDDISALAVVAVAADRLRHDLRLPWSADAGHAVARLALSGTNAPRLPAMVGLYGGASSGKSTIFDNLLGGHLASRITARGHATLGPILAAHGSRRDDVRALFATGRFLPGFQPRDIELDDNVTGAVDSVALVFHSVDALRDVLLFDLPDFTSGAAADDGDVALSLLPWFDRIIVVLDHERWFDRQSTTSLRARSVRFDQARWAVFNQTQDAHLSDAERHALKEQASNLSTRGMTILEFRRGRGLCRFPPGTFDGLIGFAAPAPPDRITSLRQCASEAANEVLNQNEERTVRLAELGRALGSVIDRTIPDRRLCMMALMTPDERRQAEWLSRVLRLNETRQWLSGQTRRLTAALRSVPVVGSVLMPRGETSGPPAQAETDRGALGVAFARRVVERHQQELRRVINASTFWDELRRWTGLEPAGAYVDNNTELSVLLDNATGELDVAIRRWNERLAMECEGLSPKVKGAIGAGTIALAVVLIAVPGPVTALTAVAAKGAIAGALTQLLTATGAGALVGGPLTRFASVVQEKLIGSPEFNAVQIAVGAFRARLHAMCAQMNDRALSEAAALVLASDDPLVHALEALRDAWEDDR